MGKVSDARRGVLGNLAFFGSAAPVASLTLRSSVTGYDLNGVQVAGFLLPPDLDTDGLVHDLTGLLVGNGYGVGKVSIAGSLLSDAVIEGDVGMMRIGAGVIGDLRVGGCLPKLDVAANLVGRLSVKWLGSARVGQIWAGRARATDADPRTGLSFGKLSAFYIGDLTLDADHGVGSISAAQWGSGMLTATRLGSLSIRPADGLPGDCCVDIFLVGEPGFITLGKASIGGTLQGAVWDIVGPVGSLTVGRWGIGSRLAAGVMPGVDGVYFTGDDVAVGGSVLKLSIAAYETTDAQDFGVLSPLFGPVKLAGLSPALPFVDGQFHIVRVV